MRSRSDRFWLVASTIIVALSALLAIVNVILGDWTKATFYAVLFFGSMPVQMVRD